MIQNSCQCSLAVLPGLLGKWGVDEEARAPQQRALVGGVDAPDPWVLALATHIPPCRCPHLLLVVLTALGGISRPICGARAWGGEEAAAGSGQELRLGVGRGLLCWELSSGNHQQGGREGAAFPGPHTPAGPVGTQPADPQPPLPAQGSPPCPALVLAWGSCSLSSAEMGGLQWGCSVIASPRASMGLEKLTHPAFVLASITAIIPSVFAIPLVVGIIIAK